MTVAKANLMYSIWRIILHFVVRYLIARYTVTEIYHYQEANAFIIKIVNGGKIDLRYWGGGGSIV